MKKQIRLPELQCSSFITELTNQNQIKGGTTDPSGCESDNPPPIKTTQGETN